MTNIGMMGRMGWRKGAVILAGAAMMAAPLVATAQEKGEADGAGSFLQDAKTACRHGDFSTFLFSFAADDAVQQAYSAPQIAFASVDEAQTRPMALDRYLELSSFPLRPFDMLIYTRDSVDTMHGHHGSRADLVGVDFTVDDSQPDRRAVTWVMGRYRPAKEEEGEGDMFEKTGGGGVLQFRWLDDCWQFVSDIRRVEGAE